MTTYSLQHHKLLFFVYTYRAVVVSVREPRLMISNRCNAQNYLRMIGYNENFPRLLLGTLDKHRIVLLGTGLFSLISSLTMVKNHQL
jgi:hypothetical protein